MVLGSSLAFCKSEATADDRPVLAISEFGSRFGTYQSQMHARAIGDQIQALLSKLDQFPLVERTQLDLARDELAKEHLRSGTLSHSIATGRWVGADWIMLGELGNGQDGRQWLFMEVVDSVDAEVLASASLSPTNDDKASPEFNSETLQEEVIRLLRKAEETQLKNRKASVVIAPLFFEHTGKLRNLEVFRERFFEELARQCASRLDVRLLRFPRVSVAQDELEMRIHGFFASPASSKSIHPIFVWGNFTEVDAEMKGPEEVPIRVHLNTVGGAAGLKQTEQTTTQKNFDALIQEMVRSTLETAVQNAASKDESPTAGRAAARELAKLTVSLTEEHAIQRRSQSSDKESLIRLSRRTISLQDIAIFLAPEDGELRRELLLKRSNLVAAHWLHSFKEVSQMNELWKGFEQNFPKDLSPTAIRQSIQSAVLLLYWGYTFKDVPRDLPAEKRAEIKLAIQLEVVKRLENLGPTQLGTAPDISNHLAYLKFFNDPQLAARFVECLWPLYLVYSAEASDPQQEKAKWKKRLEEIFLAAGRPERAAELLALPTLPGKNPTSASGPPENLRFTIRRPDLLPPLLDATPRLIGPDKENFYVNALHFDGTHLWISADKSPSKLSTSEVWDSLWHDVGSSVHLFRYLPGEITPLDLSSEVSIPSKICSIASSPGMVWCGTQQNGILQINPSSGKRLDLHDVSSGLPTNSIFALEWNGTHLLAGGGDRHRGYYFQMTPGKEGVVNLPIFGWEEKLANWREHEQEKSRYGRITLLLNAHHRTLVVASENQALLWKHGSKDGINLLQRILTGLERYGEAGQNGAVLAAVSDRGGWWLGTSAGLARLAPDGKVLRRWSPGRGPYFFEQIHWVQKFRKAGMLSRFFHMDTRLIGAVTALAADGDYLYVATSTVDDSFLPSPVEGAHLYVLHIPSEKWVGHVKLPHRVRALAQDASRLWIGFYTSPSHNGYSSSHSTSPTRVKPYTSEALLYEFDKASLKNLPENQWVEDNPSAEEKKAAIGKLSQTEQASLAFFHNNYTEVMRLLGGLPMDQVTVGELFLVAFSNDQDGLNQPAVSKTYFQEILKRRPHSFWVAEAERGLNELAQSENPK